MRKLRLDPDALRVESFAPAEDGRDGRGTVRGHSYPDGCFPPSASDPLQETCGYNTCAGDSCWQSCNGYTCVGCGGGGGSNTQCESMGYTYCLKDASCLNACIPPR